MIPTAAGYSIWLTQPKAIAMAGINCGMLFLILLYFIVSTILNKIPKIKAICPKWVLWLFRPGWTIWLAFITAFIVGLIYFSLTKETHLIFDPNAADPYGPNNDKLWVWQSIQFMYSIGSWIVIFILFSLWLSVPFIALISFTNYYKEKQNKRYHLKRILWVVAMILITLAASNLMWVFPINSHYSSLGIFHLGGVWNQHDYFYISMKVVYEHVFYTKWYIWTFITYCAICVVMAWVIIHQVFNQRIHIAFNRWFIYRDTTESYQNVFKARFSTVKFWFDLPYQISNSLGTLEFYAFFISFSLFNLASLWLHITFILIVCLIAYVWIAIIIYCYGLIKYRKDEKSFNKAFWEILWHFIKPFFFFKPYFFQKQTKAYDINKIASEEVKTTYTKNNALPSLNISCNIVVLVCFTAYLGYGNLPVFSSPYQVGTYAYSHIMHQPTFWLSLIFSTFLFTFMQTGVAGSNSYGKNVVGVGTYAITPGMQTGVLGNMSATLAHFGKWTDSVLKLVF